MKVAVIAKVAGLLDATAARVESRMSKGAVRVLSIQCLDCGRWVKPGDWNPDSAVCEMCTMRLHRDGLPHELFTRPRPGWVGQR